MLIIPFCTWMESKIIPRILSGIISLLSAIVIILDLILPVILQVRNFSRDFDDVTDRMNNYLSDVDKMANDLFDAD